ncbi:hypothetical protein [Moritella sp. 28]|uniref:hypothetical protein n=1 Tax=Moritella sp. 28 TaxID=2746232 RepID=UPI002107F4DC|nr:hypothetical protein [Moritella sp. 28]
MIQTAHPAPLHMQQSRLYLPLSLRWKQLRQDNYLLSDDENKVLQLEDWSSEGYFHLSFYEVSASAGVGLLAEVEEQPKTISFEPNWLRSEVGVSDESIFDVS